MIEQRANIGDRVMEAFTVVYINKISMPKKGEKEIAFHSEETALAKIGRLCNVLGKF